MGKKMDYEAKAIRDYLRANMFDGDDEGMLTMKTSTLLDEVSTLMAEWVRDREYNEELSRSLGRD